MRCPTLHTGLASMLAQLDCNLRPCRLQYLNKESEQTLRALLLCLQGRLLPLPSPHDPHSATAAATVGLIQPRLQSPIGMVANMQPATA